ncbi:penicillin-binding protein [Aureibacillus halotolerans]|uniref:serine-type D-Ala-D-Ala carboxypeptidase n=1 Tax=Aureibacillus halotolerans TaxID=1508390 RepID=A0A4R6U720_9BACI|nr:penicillin-binding protein [Aureibacillus halotolerans]TDQ42320.1 penicillin-binding protein 2B [Aureibacillus halotolerans]
MSTKKNPAVNVGVRVLLLAFILLFFVLFGRIVYIQAAKEVDGVQLSDYAESQRTVSKTLEAKRGTIYDRNGMPLAEDVQSYTVYAIVRDGFQGRVKDEEKVAEELAPILGVDQAYILDQLNVTSTEENPGPFQVEFGSSGSKLSYEKKEEIEALDLKGIYFIRENKRFYPNGVFASHVLGYTTENDEGEIVGVMGLEKSLDDYLQQTPGKIQYKRDKLDTKLPNAEEMVVPPHNGASVYLTFDQKIQGFLEDAMKKVEEEYTPSNMIGIVAKPETGQILAMASYPSFDPNVRDITHYQNDAISYRFEPGSTMKVFTVAAAIEEGVFNPNELYQSGRYSFNGSTAISDVRTNWGTISMLEGIQRSSNVAAGILGMEKLGPDRFLEYLKKFDLDKTTGIDLPGETNSRFVYKEPIEKLTTTFGQGTAITPIQQIKALTAVANDGKMMTPYVINEIKNSNNGETLYKGKPEVAGTPISAETAERVRTILGTAVSESVGSGKPYEMEDYDVAGKTGTAQIPGKDGSYMTGHNNYFFSFLGMVPEQDPEFVIYIGIKQPQLGLNQYGYPESGSSPVSKVFKPFVQNTMQYLDIAPREEEQKQEKAQKGFTVKEYKGTDITAVSQQLQEAGMTPVVVGSGKIVRQEPAAGETILPGARVFLLGEENPAMPDLTGYSYREFLRLSSLLNVQPNPTGSGYVVKQNVEAGQPVQEGDYLVVELEPPAPSSTANEDETNGGEDDTTDEYADPSSQGANEEDDASSSAPVE